MWNSLITMLVQLLDGFQDLCDSPPNKSDDELNRFSILAMGWKQENCNLTCWKDATVRFSSIETI